MFLGIGGLTICPFIASIPALVIGWRARRLIRDSGGILRGEQRAMTGIVLGGAGIVIGLALMTYVLGSTVPAALRYSEVQAELVAVEQVLGEMATAQESFRANSSSGAFATRVDELNNEGFVEPPNIDVAIISVTTNGYCLRGRSRTVRGVELYYSSTATFTETPC